MQETKTNNMSKSIRHILEDLGLNLDVVEAFEREKVTVDIVNQLSRDEFEKLGIFNQEIINKIVQECVASINRNVIDRDVLQSLISHGYSASDIADLMCISRSTLFRRLQMYNLSAVQYSEIDNATLDGHIDEIFKTHSNCGEVMMKGFLHERGISVPRKAMREAIHRVNSEGLATRRRRTLHRRIYSVEGPNHLWHIDGNHKLIRWGFVIHGGVDGFSRLPVYLECATNNRSSTALAAFHKGVEKYGIPIRVRTDAGGENVLIWEYIKEIRGDRSALVGKSTHNQRIERLWKDVFEGCLHHYYQLFYHLEDEGSLDPLDEVQLYALQYVFKPRINASLQEWTSAWNNHRIRTVGRTPFQLWFSGQLQNPTGVFDNIPADSEAHEEEENVNPRVIVEEPNNPLHQIQYEMLYQEIDPMRESSQHGLDVYLDVVQFITNQLT